MAETGEERSARLQKFVLGCCDGTIFTSYGLDAAETRMCFMVLSFCERDQIPKDAVLVWEEISKAGPRSINGLPCFFSCHFMNKEDWDRAHAAILAEMDRRKEIKV